MPPKGRRLKRKLSDDICTHQEVYRLVREQKIHLAEELYQLAQSDNEGGLPGLLNYCSGDGGKKKNLQKTIDAIWLPTESQESEESEHRKVLCGSKLNELQRRALKPKQFVDSAEIVDVCKGGLPSILDAGIRRLGRKKCAIGQGTQLFDHFGRQAEIIFRPHCGLWRLRDLFELLISCRQQDGLAFTEPSSAPHGGIRLPRTEAGWNSMRATGEIDEDKTFSKLSEAEKALAAAEMCLCAACGSMSWQLRDDGNAKPTKPTKPQDKWIFAMPQDDAFEKDTLYDRPMEEKLVRLWAKKHVEDKHLVGVLKALEACHHEIQQTKGFDFKKNQLEITGTKARKTAHKAGPARSTTYGLASAYAALEDQKDAVRRSQKGLAQRGFLLNRSSASDMKPDKGRSFYESAKALQDEKRGCNVGAVCA